MPSSVNLASEFSLPEAAAPVDLSVEFSMPPEDSPAQKRPNTWLEDRGHRVFRGLFAAMGNIQAATEKALGAEPQADFYGKKNMGEYVPNLSRFIDPSRDRELGSLLAEGAGAALPSMGAAVLNPVLGSVVLAGQFGEQTRAESLAAGDTPEIAAEKAKIGRLGGAVMGLLPGSFGRSGAGIVERVATRTVTGGAINTAQDLALQYAVKGDVDFEQALDSFKTGAAMGGIFSLPGPRRGVARANDASPPQPVDLASEFTPPHEIPATIEAATASPVIGPEATRAGAEKVADVTKAIADPGVIYQYSVWPREMIPEGKSRVAQIDLISPNAPTTEAMRGNWGSTNLGLLKELGLDLPDVPESLPPGRYTLEQIRAELAKTADPETKSGEDISVGLGAASPKEFQPVREFTTSIKNAVVDQERAERGLPPAMQSAQKSFGKTWDEAMQKIDENQNLPDELISELRGNPRALTDTENALLLHRKIELENQFDRVTRNIDESIGTPDSLAADRATQTRVLDELAEIDTVGREAGTETGRGLNARKMIAAEDFSLSKMLTKRRAAKGGIKLTPEEETKVRVQHDNIVKAQQELDAQLSRTKATPADDVESAKAAAALDEKANLLQAKLERAKSQYDEVLERDRFERLTGTQKLLDRAGDTYDAAKNIMTTGELSFIGRQGLIQGVSHPIRTAKSLPATFKALFSDPITARAIDLQTLNDPVAPRAREAGVHLDEPDTRLARKEEIVMSRWGDKTPIVRNFNQSGRVFLNKLRLDSFKALSDQKPNATKAELAAFADYVNQSTGRGGLGQWGERNAVALSRTLFSPRFLTSRFQYLVGNSIWGGTSATRKILAKEYALTLIGLGTIYSLYEFGFAGEDKEGYQPVSFDPRSAMFGKMKIKNTTIDPLAGLSQAIVFGTRTSLTALDTSGIETGPQYMTNKGKLVDLREPKFGQDNWLDVAERFGRSKLHPIPGTVLNLMQGRDVVGQPSTFKSEAINFISPMSYPDIYDALKAQDLDDGTAITLLALLGAGINTFQEKEARAKALKQPTKVSAPDAQQK